MSPPSVSSRLCLPRIHLLFLQRPRAALSRMSLSLLLRSSLHPPFVVSCHKDELEPSLPFQSVYVVSCLNDSDSCLSRSGEDPVRVAELIHYPPACSNLSWQPSPARDFPKLVSRISPLTDARMRITQGREASPPVWRCGNHVLNLIF